MKISVLSSAALLTLCLFSVRAAEAPRPDSINQMIPALCPAMVNSLSSDPRLKLVLSEEGLDTAVICSCANERFTGDREIRRLAALSQEDMQRQAPLVNLMASYASARGIQHIVACLAEDLDRQLASVNLPLVSAAAAAR